MLLTPTTKHNAVVREKKLLIYRYLLNHNCIIVDILINREILNINREFKDVKRKVTRQIQAKKLKTAVGLAGTLSRIGSALSNVSNAVSVTNSDTNDDSKLDIPDDGPVYSNQLLVPGM